MWIVPTKRSGWVLCGGLVIVKSLYLEVWTEWTCCCIWSFLLSLIHMKSSLATWHSQFWILNLIYTLFDTDFFFSSLHSLNGFSGKRRDMEMIANMVVIHLSFIYHIFNKCLLSIYYLLVNVGHIERFLSVLKKSLSTKKHRQTE